MTATPKPRNPRKTSNDRPKCQHRSCCQPRTAAEAATKEPPAASEKRPTGQTSPRRSADRRTRRPGPERPKAEPAQAATPPDHAAPHLRTRRDLDDAAVQPGRPIDVEQRHRQSHDQTQSHRHSFAGRSDGASSRREGQVRVRSTRNGRSTDWSRSPAGPRPLRSSAFTCSQISPPEALPRAGWRLRQRRDKKSSRVSAPFSNRPNPRHARTQSASPLPPWGGSGGWGGATNQNPNAR